jgi:hypothetical protein
MSSSNFSNNTTVAPEPIQKGRNLEEAICPGGKIIKLLNHSIVLKSNMESEPTQNYSEL